MYNFRVKKGSELEQALDAVREDYPAGATKRDMIDGLGLHATYAHTLTVLGTETDNFTLSRHGVSYVDVVPTTIVKQAENVTGAASMMPFGDDGTDIVFPEAPPMMQHMPNFRKPSWFDRMAMMVDAGKHIALSGPPGIGKSTAVEQLAVQRGKVLVNIGSDSGLRRRDLTGSPTLHHFLAAEYVTAAINGWWVKIDEANAAEPDALMYINGQIAPPYTVGFYGKSFRVHPDFRLFITYNHGLVGTKPLPESFKDRFFPIKLQFPTANGLRRLLEANGMPSEMVHDGDAPEKFGKYTTTDWTNVVVEYGLECWNQHEMGRMRYQITPRRLMDAVDLVKLTDCNVIDALEAAVVDAVDNLAEVRVLKEVLKNMKDAFEFGRM